MRLIDANELRRRIIAFCTGCSTTYLGAVNIGMMIEQAETVDAVPVVRCKECIHFDPDDEDGLCCAKAEAMLCPGENDYCSHGQRKDQSAQVRKMEDSHNVTKENT